MTIKDLCCRNCGCCYEVDEIGMTFIIHYQNKDIDTDEIKCPKCGSVSYSERYIDDLWDDDDSD